MPSRRPSQSGPSRTSCWPRTSPNCAGTLPRFWTIRWGWGDTFRRDSLLTGFCLTFQGRSALHLAASVGRYAIAEWLINHGASITLKDRESGHTALHRAMYYGCVGVAVVLLKHGAVIDVPDEDFVNPLQLCSNVHKDRDKWVARISCWVVSYLFVVGTNFIWLGNKLLISVDSTANQKCSFWIVTKDGHLISSGKKPA